MKDSANSIVRAYLDAIILSCLQKGDTYGYAVIKEVESMSGGCFILQEGPLYLEFRRMEQQGWISSYWGDETRGARRRYYSITEKGKTYLEDRKQEWGSVVRLMDDLLNGRDAGRDIVYE